MHNIWVDINNQLLYKKNTQIVGRAYIDVVCDAIHPLYSADDFVDVT